MARKRASRRAAADKPSKRARTRAAAEHISDSTEQGSVAAPSAHSSSSPSSSASSSSSASAACPSLWSALPLELLVLVADCEPSYRLLLPLSSTCRRLYELIHEESVSGVVPSANSLQDVSARVSCWRHHPSVRLTITRTSMVVDKLGLLLDERDASFVSHVLTSLRNLPLVELIYPCAGGPHAANFYPLHRFTHLRSLVLSLGAEDPAKLQNLTSNLSAALLSLTSLVDLTVLAQPIYSPLLSGAVRRLASERLLHLTVSDVHYEQLIAPEQLRGRRRAAGAQLPSYPHVHGVTLIDYCDSSCTTTLADIRRTFPNVKHVTLAKRAALDLRDLTQPGDLQALLDGLDSLHAAVYELRTSPTVSPVVGCGLRCLILSWRHHIVPGWRPRICDTLSLTPHLEQLAITGGVRHSHTQLHTDPDTERSVFDSRNPLPKLTYLQLTGGLFIGDIEYLLCSASPPAFAATLTHLELQISRSDKQRAAALLPSLPGLYRSLQRCHVGLQATPLQLPGSADAVWRAMWDGVAARLGEAISAAQAVREARLDVVWRRGAGMAPVPDDWPDNVPDGDLFDRDDEDDEDEA